MGEPSRRARELLAAEWAADAETVSAGGEWLLAKAQYLRSPDIKFGEDRRALRAIDAAIAEERAAVVAWLMSGHRRHMAVSRESGITQKQELAALLFAGAYEAAAQAIKRGEHIVAHPLGGKGGGEGG